MPRRPRSTGQNPKPTDPSTRPTGTDAKPTGPDPKPTDPSPETKRPNPIVWAIAIVIVAVFLAVAYRIVSSCEESSIDLVKYLKVNLGGCKQPQPQPTPQPQPVPQPSAQPPPQTKDLCAEAVQRSHIPMCGWWQISKTSSLTGGIKIASIPFNETLLPLFRFEIGPYQREDQLTQIYAGTVVLRDGRTAPALFNHHRWANSKTTDVDFERFDISIKPGTLFNQAYQISYGGYYDRDKGQFVTVSGSPGSPLPKGTT
jgi:hypothetical protein